MIDYLKKQIIDGRFQHKLLDKLSDYQVDSKDAYKIQEEINNILSNNGLGKIIGYKIGCTNKAIQKELNVVEPIYGALFKNKVIKNNSNISIKNFIKVGVECEIYVTIAKNIINQDQFSKEKIENLINYCGLSLEIVEDRFVEIKKNTIEHIIIDGSLGNSIILGKKINKNISIKNENLNEKKYYEKIIKNTSEEITNIIKSQNLVDVRTPSFLNTKFEISRKNNLVELNEKLKQLKNESNVTF